MWNTANRILQTMGGQSVTSIGKRKDSNPTLYGNILDYRTHLKKVQKKVGLLCLNLAVIRISSRIGQNLHRETHRYLGFFSSHNTYYVKKTILLDN